MKLSCLFGHKWDGCTCARCGETRNEGHEFTTYTPNGKECVGHCKCGWRKVFKHDYQTVPGKCYDVCTRCGAEARYVPGHAAHHAFERVSGKCQLKCTVCGATNDIQWEDHDWQRQPGTCLEKCATCGKERYAEHDYQRVPGTCREKCAVCGRERALDHTWEHVEGTCTDKCAVCGETRESHNFVNGRCSRCGQQSDDAFMDDCVEKLLAIFPTTPLDPAGHRRFDAAHRAEVREIGVQLDALGGMRAMRKVGMAFAQRRPIHARKLETTWDGIGNWMG